MNTVAIIGSGSFGCALAYVLSKNNKIKMWSYTKEEQEYINNKHTCMVLKNCKLDKNIKCYLDLEETIKGVDYIVLVTPSKTIRNVCKELKKYITNQKIVLASKGLENDKLLSEVIKEELNIMPSIISGPSHAEQIVKEVPTFVEYSGEKEIKEFFETNNFKLIYNKDFIGLELGGVLKNVISIIIGLAEGLGYESNTISYIITEGLKEIKDVGTTMGAKESTFYGLSGLGDLLTTSLSNDSRNKKAGLLL